MLTHLYIKHFTIIHTLNLDLTHQLTVLTGETGAGKSILIDALELILGGRADTSFIQTGQDRCEIIATFNITHIPTAQKWLTDQALDDAEDCMIARIISRDGRSRNTINGRPCTLQQLRDLGTLLVHIHGQNQHTLLTQNEYQRKLLDTFAMHDPLCQNVRKQYETWRQADHELRTLNAMDGNQEQQKTWLRFQIEELQELNLTAGELESCETEHKKLSHATQSIQVCEQLLGMLSDNESCVLNQLNAATHMVRQLPQDTQLMQSISLLEQSTINIGEAQTDIRRYLQGLNPDPEQLHALEQRLVRIHDLARKHKVLPEELHLKQRTLEKELEALASMDERIAALGAEIERSLKHYHTAAKALTQSRQKAAATLNHAVTLHLQQLGMQNGKLEVTLLPKEDARPQLHGNERVTFLIVTNPGQPPQSLAKVASGGELSRISLAIQVVTAQVSNSPTLIFDEVDVGIGGKTAEIVGQQLRSLGEKAQVLCVTHLPQVAAKGHQHLHIEKQTDQEKVSTHIRVLSPEEKIREIARMLGGVNITEKTLAHAEEMVSSG